LYYLLHQLTEKINNEGEVGIVGGVRRGKHCMTMTRIITFEDYQEKTTTGLQTAKWRIFKSIFLHFKYTGFNENGTLQLVD
jgi:hypothetical protein